MDLFQLSFVGRQILLKKLLASVGEKLPILKNNLDEILQEAKELRCQHEAEEAERQRKWKLRRKRNL